MRKRPLYDIAIHVGSEGYTLVALGGQSTDGARTSRTLATDAPIGYWADAVATVVGPVSGRNPRAVLLIASDWWIGVPIPLGSMGSRRHDVILYEVEAQLGYLLENLYIGIVRQGDLAMTFTVFRQAVDEVTARCAEAGIDAWAAHPTALLALRHWQEANNVSADVLVWPSQEGERFSLWDLRGQRVNSWQLAFGTEDLANRIRSFESNEGATPGINSIPRESDDLAVTVGTTRWVEDISEDEAALRFVEECSGSNSSSTVEIPLMPRARFSATGIAWMSWVCGGAALVALIVGTLWSAARLDGAAERLHAAQSAAYRRAFPGQPVPSSVLRALQASWDQSTRPEDANSTFTSGRNVLEGLRTLTGQLPHEIEPVITEVRIDHEGVEMAGESPSHVAAARLAESLARGANFVVGDPQTTVGVEGKFRFAISARFTGVNLQSSLKLEGAQ